MWNKNLSSMQRFVFTLSLYIEVSTCSLFTSSFSLYIRWGSTLLSVSYLWSYEQELSSNKTKLTLLPYLVTELSFSLQTISNESMLNTWFLEDQDATLCVPNKPVRFTHIISDVFVMESVLSFWHQTISTCW